MPDASLEDHDEVYVTGSGSDRTVYHTDRDCTRLTSSKGGARPVPTDHRILDGLSECASCSGELPRHDTRATTASELANMTWDDLVEGD